MARHCAITTAIVIGTAAAAATVIEIGTVIAAHRKII
jgi:hypothetical protein